jgi:hypothetical protein
MPTFLLENFTASFKLVIINFSASSNPPSKYIAERRERTF